MPQKVIWSPHAANGLEEICLYIGRDSKRYAAIFAQRIFSAIEQIAIFPEIGRIVPEYNNPTLREKILGDYRIVFQIKVDTLEIVAIIHGARILKL